MKYIKTKLEKAQIPTEIVKSLNKCFTEQEPHMFKKHMSKYLVLIMIDTCTFKLGVHVQCIDMKSCIVLNGI